MNAPILIAFACDEGYAKHVAVVMQSILANATSEARHEFHILTMNLSLDAENRIAEIANRGRSTTIFHRLGAERLAGFPTTVLPLETYLRLLLPELLPDLDRILYLDADLIVLDSLDRLWEFPLNDKAVAAAIDTITILKGEMILAHFQALEIPKEHIYFNAGVLLLNLKVLREMQILDLTKKWAKEHEDLMINSDQDALNVILAGKVEYFNLRWNLQAPLIAPVKLGWKCSKEHINAVTDPAIIHYVTNRKPWKKEFKLPYQDLYFKHLLDTPWRDSRQPLALDFVWHRWMEELEWQRKLVMSKLRNSIGRRFVLSDEG